MKELGVGIIGTGGVSDEYIRSFEMNPHTRVIAICSRDKAKAAAKAAQHQLKNCAAVTRPEELVKLLMQFMAQNAVAGGAQQAAG